MESFYWGNITTIGPGQVLQILCMDMKETFFEVTRPIAKLPYLSKQFTRVHCRNWVSLKLEGVGVTSGVAFRLIVIDGVMCMQMERQHRKDSLGNDLIVKIFHD
jgi:hypothetical protein